MNKWITKTLAVISALFAMTVPVKAEVIIQYFETEWDEIYRRLPELAEIGFQGIWHPSPSKAPVAGDFPNGYGGNVGYNMFDRFDVGDRPQRGTLHTRYGTRGELENMATAAHRTGLKIYPDIVFNHTGNGPHFDTYPGMRYWDFHGWDDANEPYGFKRAPRMFYWTPDNGCGGTLWQELVSLIDIQLAADNRFSAGGWCNLNMVTPGNFVRMAGDYDRYPFHNPGDTLPSEWPYEFINRWIHWLGNVIDFDGTRLDAPKHVPREVFGEPGQTGTLNHEIQWSFDSRRGFSDPNQYDEMYTPDIHRDDALIFGEMFIFDKSEVSYWRDWNGGAGPDNASGVKMRYLDFPLLEQMMTPAFNGGNMAALAGFSAFGDKEGMSFVHSHDKDSIGKKELAYAYALTHAGIPIVFFTGNNFDGNWTGWKSWMLQGYENALNDWGGSPIPNLVYIHNQFARYSEWKRWDDSDVYIYERFDDKNFDTNPNSPEGLLLVGLNDSGGDQTRTVNVAFADGTVLHDYTGNNGNDVTVSGGQVTITIPGMNGQGFVCYAPYNAGADGDPLRFSNSTQMDWVVPDGQLGNGDKPRTVTRITGNTTDIDVHFTQPIGGVADWAMVKWGQGEVVNATATYHNNNGIINGGFHDATEIATGHWRLTADLTNIPEGLHVIQGRVFNQRPSGYPELFQTFREVVYVDRVGPDVDPVNLPDGDTIYGDRVIEIINDDKTAGWIEVNVNGTGWQTAHEVMKGKWKFAIQGLGAGSHTIQIRAHEYDLGSPANQINSTTISRNFTVVDQGWTLTINHAEGSTQYMPFFKTSGAKDSDKNITLLWDGFEMDNVADNGGTWEQYFTGAYKMGGESKQFYGAFINGVHFFEAVLDDGAGNYQVVARTVNFNMYNQYGNSTLAYDSDGDGIPDDIEIINFLDGSNPGPNVPLPGDDSYDNIPNFGENWTRLNPMNHDTTYNGTWDGDEDWDGDGFNNLCEVMQGYLEHGDPAFYNIYDGSSKPNTCDTGGPIPSQVSWSPNMPNNCEGSSVTISYVANEGVLSNAAPIEVGVEINNSGSPTYYTMNNNGGTWQYTLNISTTDTSIAIWFRDQATGTIFDNNGGANWNIPVSICVNGTTCFNMDGLEDSANYIVYGNNMKILAAVQNECLYVATWSAHNADTTASDHFLFITDEYGDAQPAPWGKDGAVKIDLTTKPKLVAESDPYPNAYYAIDNGGTLGQVAMGDNGDVLEGELNLIEVFGYVPDTIYLAAVAYGDNDGDGINSQGPGVWDGGNSIETMELLPVCVESIRDQDGDGYFDKGQPVFETTVNGDVNDVQDANYNIRRFIINELAGESQSIEFYFQPNLGPGDTVSDVELISNLNRRDFATLDYDLDMVTANDPSAYFRAYPMTLNSGKYEVSLPVDKCGAYRATVRYKINGSSEYTYYTDNCLRRDLAIIVSPSTVLDTTIYEVNPSIVEATDDTFAGRSTFEDLYIANTDRPDRLNVDHYKALGVNMLWLQPIHPIGIDGRDNNPETNQPWDPGSPYAVRDYWKVNPILGDDNTEADAMAEFQAFVTALDQAGVGVMMDGTFNHSAPDCIIGQGGADLFGLNASDEIRQARIQWFAKAGSPGESATTYQSNNNNDIAIAPDRIDFGKWTDVRELYFGNYDCLVKGGTSGDWNSKHFHEYLSERDLFYGHDQYTMEVWEYFAYYPLYWLTLTGCPEGTPKAEATYKGIDGLRCDFAQGLPNQFWEYCINKTRQRKWNFLFMAESLDGSRTVDGNTRHGVGFRSSRHFDILNENMVFTWRDQFFNYQTFNGGGEGPAANPSTSLMQGEFSSRRTAFDDSPLLLNITSHDEVFPSDEPYRMLYAYASLSAMPGCPMVMYGQEAGALNDVNTYSNGVFNSDNNWTRYETNFGKSIPNFKRYNDMSNVWDNRDWNLQNLYGRIGKARESSRALRGRNDYFLETTSGGYNERIWAMAKFETPGVSAATQDVVFVFVNNDFTESTNRWDSYVLDVDYNGKNWFGIDPTHMYNLRDLLSANPTQEVWASDMLGADLIANGITVGLWENPYDLKHAQYLQLLDKTVPKPDNDMDGTPDIEDWDDDNDGLPDWWEDQYGMDPYSDAGADGADMDNDGDGHSNYEEYIAGTDPNAVGDVLAAHIERDPSGMLRVSWSSVDNQNYALERSNEIDDANREWMEIYRGTAQGVSEFIMDNVPLDKEHWFYRVRVIE